ncbi:MAG: hypothetical protein S0880_24240 [Actinomycetota bacterium]|nr:hypothetical protein [Actinomycetota bacterium]
MSDIDPVTTGDAGIVTLQLPASTAYLRLVRLSVAGVAGEHGFSVDEIDDLRIAIDEVCSLLLDGGGGPRIDLRFEPGSDGLVIEASRPAIDGDAADDPDGGGLPDLVEMILSATVDEHSLVVHDGVRRCRLQKMPFVDAESGE